MPTWAWFVTVFLVLYFLKALTLLYQYERAVVFTLGRFSYVLEPGLRLVWPIFQAMRRVDMRIKTADVPRQEIITRDNIPVLANTVVYFRVMRPEDAIIKIEDYIFAVRQYTQAALRDVVGNSELDFVLTEREKIGNAISQMVEAETGDWGVDIESIKIQEIELPAEMKRAMAKQAEAERERRAVIIASEGELSASVNLQQAAENLSKSPGALHLRTLQTIRDIAADPSEKIVLFLPAEATEVARQFLSRG
ncbi:MAG: slipin family protein [candidate division WS1 bacterium]|nr:slipin family protein [candidate division WS1 bacterium]